MKKLIIVLICIGLVCAGGLPIANGIIMERTIKSAVEENNNKAAKIGMGAQVKILEYDRGLFSSRVKWCIESPSGFPGSDAMKLFLVNQGTHGLFSVNTQTSLKENSWYAQWVDTHLDGKDPLSIQTRFTLAGTMAADIHLAPFSFDDEGKKVDVHALDLNISTEKGIETLTTKGKWEGLSQGSMFMMGPMTFSSDMYQITELLWAGKSTLSLEKFKLSDGSPDSMDLSNLTLNYDTQVPEDKKTIAMYCDFHVDRIELGGKSLSDWAAAFKLKQVDTASFEKAMVLYSDIFTQAGKSLEQSGDDPGDFQSILKQEMARNSPQLMAVLDGLLTKGLGLEITGLAIDLPQGKVTGKLDLSLKKDLDPSNIFVFAMQPEQIFTFFNLDTQLKLPYALAGGIPNLTTPLFPGMATGFFVVQDEFLTLDMHIKEDKLFLNGNQMVLTQ